VVIIAYVINWEFQSFNAGENWSSFTFVTIPIELILLYDHNNSCFACYPSNTCKFGTMLLLGC